ncbi:hypothetical protein [Mycoplasma capricolum]|uniref:Uncharacterized protein n=2 Tax=Mycoplasma capricolum TaxID=2095 RepID=A0A9N7G9F5_MYCCC|nr:hypothetical protein [Mycoplasma capricolum]AJK51308.1 hypothetical protein MCCG_0331 [Mycoplasma capricolum subsp. capripneumoniae 87001]AOQ22484.1 hypothetical protein M1601_01480 [Mycoplasma capricolum subsp. capripneumoniae M1601]KEY84242.1 hypothetical protein MCCP_8170 [Mycoplasma capricolum subsp. capripneumoniae 99108]WGD32826.1 hypothetical protein Mccp14020TZ_03320 [Mycoplasma capricolum subsp. capripneumoniae]CDZ18125.1 conserved protein of unknown function [Mycoplasma capricolum
MNIVNLIGQLKNDAEIVSISNDEQTKIYSFLLQVPKKGNRDELEVLEITANSNAVDDEFLLHEGAVLGIEGHLVSVALTDWPEKLIQKLLQIEFYI